MQHVVSVRLSALVALGFLACSGDKPPAKTPPPGPSATEPAAPGPQLSPAQDGPYDGPVPARRLRRLSHREYDNVVRDLLGDTTAPGRRFLTDTYVNGFDNGSAALTVQTDQAAAYQQAAEAVAARAAVGDLGGLLGGCTPESDGEATCRDRFIAGFGRRAFRRPLRPDEAERLATVFAAGQTAGGFRLGVQATLEAILQSPQFLYRDELGPADAMPDAEGRVRLDGFALATQLAFLVTGSLPDAALGEAAQAGRLESPDDLARELQRLLATPAARAHLPLFFHQWLTTDRVTNVTKDARLYPTFNPTLAAAMRQEVELFLGEVLFSGTGSLKELLTSTTGFVEGNALARLYGVPTGSGVRRVSLDPQRRQGLLTRAGFLATHAAPDSSAPITRGVFTLEHLLCVELPPPPAGVIPQPPAQGTPGVRTTRERFAAHSSEAACRGCHRLIDGVGFGFEEFDAIGAYRTMEAGVPVDTRGELIGTDVDGPFAGVSALSAKLLASKQFRGCVARHLYRFAMGEVEPHTERPLGALADKLTADGHLIAFLEALVRSPAFRFRRAEVSP